MNMSTGKNEVEGTFFVNSGYGIGSFVKSHSNHVIMNENVLLEVLWRGESITYCIKFNTYMINFCKSLKGMNVLKMRNLIRPKT